MIPLIDLKVPDSGGLRGFHTPVNPLPSILLKSSLLSVLNFGNTFSYYKIVSFLLFLIVCIFLFRVITAKDEIRKASTKSYPFSEIQDSLQTGDLVFVSYKNTLGYFMRGWAHSVWTHVGMIMRDGEDLYVMETADYTSVKEPVKKPVKDVLKESIDSISLKQFNKKGIFVVPFEIWKSLNKHHTISCIPLDTPQSPQKWDRRKLILEFWKIQQSKLDEFGVGVGVWSKVLWKKKFETQEQNEKQNITCFELIVKILQNANVAKKIYTPGSYYTGELADRKLELEPGFSFGKPYVIKNN